MPQFDIFSFFNQVFWILVSFFFFFFFCKYFIFTFILKKIKLKKKKISMQLFNTFELKNSKILNNKNYLNFLNFLIQNNNFKKYFKLQKTSFYLWNLPYIYLNFFFTKKSL